MKITREQKIAALRIARARIASGKHTHICYALPNGAKGDYLRKYVMKQLGNRISYAGWMEQHHMGFYRVMDRHNLREARLQWIDWMIENAT